MYQEPETSCRNRAFICEVKQLAKMSKKKGKTRLKPFQYPTILLETSQTEFGVMPSMMFIKYWGKREVASGFTCELEGVRVRYALTVQ